MASAEVFQHHLRVTASDCTVGNHVYYSRYLDWLEAARGEMLRVLGQPLSKLVQDGVMLPVVEAQIRYHMPARFDDRVVVRLWIEEITRVKVVFAADIVNADTGKTLVSARTTHVCTDLHDKPQRLPPALASVISAHVRTELA